MKKDRFHCLVNSLREVQAHLATGRFPGRIGSPGSGRSKGADFRQERNPLKIAADFAAAIRGIPKEDLLSQELRQQRRALTLKHFHDLWR